MDKLKREDLYNIAGKTLILAILVTIMALAIENVAIEKDIIDLKEENRKMKIEIIDLQERMFRKDI